MNWEIVQNIAVSIGSMIAAVVIGLITFKKKMDDYFDHKKTNVPGKIIKQSDVDNKILTKMEHIKEALGADRILVFDFHNGEHFANGRSALRMSASYEVVRYGVERKQNVLQKLPLSILPNLIKELLEKGYFVVDDFEKFKYMQPEYSICASLNMRSLYNYIIKDDNGAPVGFVSIEFKDIKETINEELTHKLVWFIEEKINCLVEK
jgi:hypothetical protein